MNRRSFWITAGLALVLTMPFAGATWYTRGSFEPDTPEDVSGGFMWTEPDQSPDAGVRQLYFNAVPQDRSAGAILVPGFVNPNVARLESRYIPTGYMSFTAYLGFWKDCNQDGYIGSAEGALLHYRNELLTVSSVCPPESYHNRRGWVSEFIAISDDERGLQPKFPRAHMDAEARVWGDFGLPGTSEVHYDCPQTVFPRGTFETTGGMLGWVDCQFAYHGARTINSIDSDGSLGLRFEDPHHPERDCRSALNQRVPGGVYGNGACTDETGTLEASDDSMFTVWDCNEPTGTAEVHDPRTGESMRRIPSLRPSLGNPEGSLTAGLDNAYRGLVRNCATGSHVISNNTDLEDDFTQTNPTDGKRLPDFTFRYIHQGYSAAGQGHPSGQGATQFGLALHDAGTWRSNFTYLAPTYTGGTIRMSDLAPAPALPFTFYANVGTATTGAGIQLPSADKVATYGAEACPVIGPGAGKSNNWDCDPTHWWNPEYGNPANEFGARPGDTYNMRDVDCYDGQLAGGAPVYASLVFLSEDGPCAEM